MLNGQLYSKSKFAAINTQDQFRKILEVNIHPDKNRSMKKNVKRMGILLKLF